MISCQLHHSHDASNKSTYSGSWAPWPFLSLREKCMHAQLHLLLNRLSKTRETFAAWTLNSVLYDIKSRSEECYAVAAWLRGQRGPVFGLQDSPRPPVNSDTVCMASPQCPHAEHTSMGKARVYRATTSAHKIYHLSLILRLVLKSSWCCELPDGNLALIEGATD